jgi:drug/metabolite transporter (DMT)-like permease
MFASVLTTVFFALSIIFAARSAHFLGANRANLARMLVALFLLGLWAFTQGQGLRGQSLSYYLWSGMLGFGMGDVAMFVAVTRIGPALTVLIIQCLAAPLGALIEWAWLGTWLTLSQVVCSVIILAGVAIAVAPGKDFHRDKRELSVGLIAGLAASLGQALGAVTSRKAAGIAIATGLPIDGGTAAFQRMIAGIIFTAAFYFIWKKIRPNPPAVIRPDWRAGLAPMLLNGLLGPSIGVGCYQWALATTPSGLVLPIVAATPVVAMPLAFLLNGEKPSKRGIFGGLVAVAGTIGLIRVG